MELTTQLKSEYLKTKQNEPNDYILRLRRILSSFCSGSNGDWCFSPGTEKSPTGSTSQFPNSPKRKLIKTHRFLSNSLQSHLLHSSSTSTGGYPFRSLYRGYLHRNLTTSTVPPSTPNPHRATHLAPAFLYLHPQFSDSNSENPVSTAAPYLHHDF